VRLEFFQKCNARMRRDPQASVVHGGLALGQIVDEEIPDGAALQCVAVDELLALT